MRHALLCVVIALVVLAGRAWGASLHEEIDRLIEQAAGGPLAAVADDGEFLRRVYLDLAGTIPTADEARQFLQDSAADKRAALIDRLLAGPDYPRRMKDALSVMLLERRPEPSIPDAAWERYVTDSFAANKPFNQFVSELLFVDDKDESRKPAQKFLLASGRKDDPHLKAQDIARLFLGRDMMCAQCHDHPNVEDYTQADYFGIFTYLKDKPTEAKTEFESVFVSGKHVTGPRLPGGQEVQIPPLDGSQPEEAAAWQPRRLLARDLPTAENELFVRNTVNRFWWLLMGRGLVHPLDALHEANPPSHPELLETLQREFVAHGFDVKYLLREIALSRSYQRSSRLPAEVTENDAPPQHYQAALARPLSAEQLAWATMRATGTLAAVQQAAVPEKITFTVNDYLNGRIPPPQNLPEVLLLFAGIFGNPPGEPEDEFNPAMGHALFLMNDQLVLQWTRPQEGNLTHRLSQLADDRQAVEEMYLSVLTRLPSAEESDEAVAYLQAHTARRGEALADLVWSLLASAEFRCNH